MPGVVGKPARLPDRMNSIPRLPGHALSGPPLPGSADRQWTTAVHTGPHRAEVMVKALVATSATQGFRDNDYHWCIEGELVWIAPTCAKDRDDPDGGCGCGRGFAGLSSHRATTTAMVRTLHGISRDDYVMVLRSSVEEQGYDIVDVEGLADSLLELVADLPEGAVLEHRLDYVQVRQGVPY